MRYLISFILFFTTLPVFAQRQLSVIIVDSQSRQPLPFATIRIGTQGRTVISAIDGEARLQLPPRTTVSFTYVGYHGREIPADSIRAGDSIFLRSRASTLEEVVVRPQPDRVSRIVNTAIRHKRDHNPELYELYRCNIYYKMKLDLGKGFQVTEDTSQSGRRKRDPGTRRGSGDSSLRKRLIGDDNHLFFSETFSRRYYERPQQLQDVVLASRFSGLKKTYFANLVTEVLPFHVYSDYISLNGNDYSNPIARGWQKRYDLFIADEIVDGRDTTFILSFEPRRTVGVKGLKGLVYINTDGYAISHFIAATTDSASNREIRIEQVYQKVDGRWFPAELNYDLIFGTTKSQLFATHINGHSIIDSVSFTRTKDFRFNRAYTARLHDSVDIRSADEWRRFRRDSLTQKELNTYRVLDSISRKKKLEKYIAWGGRVGTGRLPLGIFDLDLLRVVSTNDYERVRLGAGLYTNETLSGYFSIGGWAGYGIRDKAMKFGASGTFYAGGNKDNWLRVSYENDYQNAGNVRIHRDIDRGVYRNWILAQVDHKKELSMTAHARTGYLEVELQGQKQHLVSQYDNKFQYGGKSHPVLDVKEASLGLRFAYGEKRIPVFGYYVPISTKYPIVYLRTSIGNAESPGYSANYMRVLGGITYSRRTNRWGRDAIRAEAGIIHSLNHTPFSRSLLLAAKGFRTDGLNYYAWGGFLTFRPFDYFNDRYVSLLYRHDFEKSLWKFKYSKPYISLAHNFIYGSLEDISKASNQGEIISSGGYHESGLLLNQLLQKNFFGAMYVYINAGLFYHWTPGPGWEKNALWVVGVSTGF